jgi:polysaccharide biosynthesis/export protein
MSSHLARWLNFRFGAGKIAIQVASAPALYPANSLGVSTETDASLRTIILNACTLAFEAAAQALDLGYRRQGLAPLHHREVALLDTLSQSPPARGVALLATTAMLALAGCAHMVGGSGPTTATLLHADHATAPASGAPHLVELTMEVAQRARALTRAPSFAEALGEAPPVGNVVGRGDVLEVTVWEAPPATLFGAADMRLASYGSMSGHATVLPEQIVEPDGAIRVPFAGLVSAQGRSLDAIGADITSRLAGKANHPQVILRVLRKPTANVTVMGEVTNATRFALTSRGERLLDALAAAGGTKQALAKMTIQISRAGRNVTMPLDQVIRDPAQNVRLAADDVVSALYQPYSFVALGASGTNAEIPFEATGLTLAQALGRMGGLKDERANPRGLFVFRMEKLRALAALEGTGDGAGDDALVPVIYRLDLSQPSSVFIAQGFALRHRDVVYASNAPIADLQKFVGLVSQLAVTGLTVSSIAP